MGAVHGNYHQLEWSPTEGDEYGTSHGLPTQGRDEGHILTTIYAWQLREGFSSQRTGYHLLSSRCRLSRLCPCQIPSAPPSHGRPCTSDLLPTLHCAKGFSFCSRARPFLALRKEDGESCVFGDNERLRRWMPGNAWYHMAHQGERKSVPILTAQVRALRWHGNI